MKKILFFIGFLLLFSLLIAGCQSEDPLFSPPDFPWGENPPAVDLLNQFSAIQPKGGSGLAFTYAQEEGIIIGDNPWECKHYQGITRIDAEDGVYFYLTRSGNKNIVCPFQEHEPGELLIVRMDSKAAARQHTLGTNRGDEMTGLPPIEDTTIASIHFNGTEGWPAWMHPGSGQVWGDLMAIPLESPYPEDGDTGGIIFLDVSDPATPYMLRLVESYEKCGWLRCKAEKLPKVGVLAMARIPNGNLLFALSGGVFTTKSALMFLESNTPDVTDPDFKLRLLDTWDANTLLPDENADNWNCGRTCKYSAEYQSHQFVLDADGNIYLVAMDNDTVSTFEGWDLARLFQVTSGLDTVNLTYLDELHLYLNDPVEMGDLDAASSVYVTEDGQLILYTADHDNEGPEVNGFKVLEFGEFASVWEQ